jgi:hypothetical protein
MKMLFFLFKRRLLCQILLLFFLQVSWAQNVTILPNGINPAPVGTIPRLSYEAILALPSPQLGDLAVDLTFRVMRMYNGLEWAIFKTSVSQDLTDYTAMGLGGLFPADVATDNAGNIYTTGRFEGTVTVGGLSLTSVGGTDIFVAKFNRFGTVQWLRRGGGSNFVEEEGKSIAVDGSGNVYVTGYFSTTANFNTPSSTGTNELVSAGSTDIFVAKYNTSGALQWLRRGGGTSGEFGKGIAVDGSGNVYVTGYFSTTANFNTPSATGSNELVSAGNTDVFVAKYNTSGVVQWLRRGGGTGSDEGNGIGVDGSGNVYVVGFFNSKASFNVPSVAGSFDLVSDGERDIFVVKFSTLGTPEWVQRGGGTDFDEGKDIAVDSNGDFYITGYFVNTANFNTPSASGSNELISAGSGDIFVLKYNTFGGLLWRRRGGGTGNDFGEAIVGRSGGNIFVTGAYNGVANFNTPSASGSNELQPFGLFDLFVAEYFSTGVLLGLQRGGGQTDDVGKGIAIGAFGALHVVGSYESFVQFGLTQLPRNTSGSSYSGFITFMKQ